MRGPCCARCADRHVLDMPADLFAQPSKWPSSCFVFACFGSQLNTPEVDHISCKLETLGA